MKTKDISHRTKKALETVNAATMNYIGFILKIFINAIIMHYLFVGSKARIKVETV